MEVAGAEGESGIPVKVSWRQLQKSAPSRTTLSFMWLLMSQEEVRRHGNADGDDEAADDLRIEFLGVMGPAIPTQDGAQKHHQGLWPQHYACRDEGNHGCSIDGGIEERFQGIHGVNIFHP